MILLFQLVSLIATVVFGEVTELDIESISQFIKKNEVALIKMYAPWCGACKRIAPFFQEASETLAGFAALGKIDVTDQDNMPVAIQYGVKHYPTLKFFVNGKEHDYTGGIQTADIVRWVKDMSEPVGRFYDSCEEASEAHPDKVSIVYRGSQNPTNKMYKMFQQAAEDNRGNMTFVGCPGKSGFEMLLKDGSSVAIPKPLEARDIMDFVSKNIVGLFDKITPDNALALFEIEDMGFPLVFLAAETEEYEKVRKNMEIIAEEFKESYKFCFMDTIVYEKEASQLLMNLEEYPGMLINDKPVHDTQPTWQLTGVDFTKPEAIRKWLNGILSGEIKSDIKSEPIPKSNDGLVKIIVGKNFDDIVTDKEDIIIKMYAPWCKHCKAIATLYEDMARVLRDISPKTVVAEMNISENDVADPNFSVKSIPTIYFKPAGKKPILYEGLKTPEDMIEFIEKEGTNKVGKVPEGIMKRWKEETKERIAAKEEEDKEEEDKEQEMAKDEL